MKRLPFGAFAATTTQGSSEAAIAPGVIFCLRAVGERAKAIEPDNPLAPHYLVHEPRWSKPRRLQVINAND